MSDLAGDGVVERKAQGNRNIRSHCLKWVKALFFAESLRGSEPVIQFSQTRQMYFRRKIAPVSVHVRAPVHVLTTSPAVLKEIRVVGVKLAYLVSKYAANLKHDPDVSH